MQSVTALQVELSSSGAAIRDTGAGILLPWMRNQLFSKSAWDLSLFHSLHFSCAGRMTTPIGRAATHGAEGEIYVSVLGIWVDLFPWSWLAQEELTESKIMHRGRRKDEG